METLALTPVESEGVVYDDHHCNLYSETIAGEAVGIKH